MSNLKLKLPTWQFNSNRREKVSQKKTKRRVTDDDWTTDSNSLPEIPEHLVVGRLPPIARHSQVSEVAKETIQDQKSIVGKTEESRVKQSSQGYPEGQNDPSNRFVGKPYDANESNIQTPWTGQSSLSHSGEGRTPEIHHVETNIQTSQSRLDQNTSSRFGEQVNFQSHHEGRTNFQSQRNGHGLNYSTDYDNQTINVDSSNRLAHPATGSNGSQLVQNQQHRELKDKTYHNMGNAERRFDENRSMGVATSHLGDGLGQSHPKIILQRQNPAVASQQRKIPMQNQLHQQEGHPPYGSSRSDKQMPSRKMVPSPDVLLYNQFYPSGSSGSQHATRKLLTQHVVPKQPTFNAGHERSILERHFPINQRVTTSPERQEHFPRSVPSHNHTQMKSTLGDHRSLHQSQFNQYNDHCRGQDILHTGRPYQDIRGQSPVLHRARSYQSRDIMHNGSHGTDVFKTTQSLRQIHGIPQMSPGMYIPQTQATQPMAIPRYHGNGNTPEAMPFRRNYANDRVGLQGMATSDDVMPMSRTPTDLRSTLNVPVNDRVGQYSSLPELHNKETTPNYQRIVVSTHPSDEHITSFQDEILAGTNVDMAGKLIERDRLIHDLSDMLVDQNRADSLMESEDFLRGRSDGSDSECDESWSTDGGNSQSSLDGVTMDMATQCSLSDDDGSFTEVSDLDNGDTTLIGDFQDCDATLTLTKQVQTVMSPRRKDKLIAKFSTQNVLDIDNTSAQNIRSDSSLFEGNKPNNSEYSTLADNKNVSHHITHDEHYAENESGKPESSHEKYVELSSCDRPERDSVVPSAGGVLGDCDSENRLHDFGRTNAWVADTVTHLNLEEKDVSKNLHGVDAEQSVDMMDTQPSPLSERESSIRNEQPETPTEQEVQSIVFIQIPQPESTKECRDVNLQYLVEELNSSFQSNIDKSQVHDPNLQHNNAHSNSNVKNQHNLKHVIEGITPSCVAAQETKVDLSMLSSKISDEVTPKEMLLSGKELTSSRKRHDLNIEDALYPDKQNDDTLISKISDNGGLQESCPSDNAQDVNIENASFLTMKQDDVIESVRHERSDICNDSDLSLNAEVCITSGHEDGSDRNTRNKVSSDIEECISSGLENMMDTHKEKSSLPDIETGIRSGIANESVFSTDTSAEYHTAMESLLSESKSTDNLSKELDKTVLSYETSSVMNGCSKNNESNKDNDNIDVPLTNSPKGSQVSDYSGRYDTGDFFANEGLFGQTRLEKDQLVKPFSRSKSEEEFEMAESQIASNDCTSLTANLEDGNFNVDGMNSNEISEKIKMYRQFLDKNDHAVEQSDTLPKENGIVLKAKEIPRSEETSATGDDGRAMNTRVSPISPRSERKKSRLPVPKSKPGKVNRKPQVITTKATLNKNHSETGREDSSSTSGTSFYNNSNGLYRSVIDDVATHGVLMSDTETLSDFNEVDRALLALEESTSKLANLKAQQDASSSTAYETDEMLSVEIDGDLKVSLRLESSGTRRITNEESSGPTDHILKSKRAEDIVDDLDLDNETAAMKNELHISESDDDTYLSGARKENERRGRQRAKGLGTYSRDISVGSLTGDSGSKRSRIPLPKSKVSRRRQYVSEGEQSEGEYEMPSFSRSSSLPRHGGHLRTSTPGETSKPRKSRLPVVSPISSSKQTISDCETSANVAERGKGRHRSHSVGGEVRPRGNLWAYANSPEIASSEVNTKKSHTLSSKSRAYSSKNSTPTFSRKATPIGTPKGGSLRRSPMKTKQSPTFKSRECAIVPMSEWHKLREVLSSAEQSPASTPCPSSPRGFGSLSTSRRSSGDFSDCTPTPVSPLLSPKAKDNSYHSTKVATTISPRISPKDSGNKQKKPKQSRWRIDGRVPDNLKEKYSPRKSYDDDVSKYPTEDEILRRRELRGIKGLLHSQEDLLASSHDSSRDTFPEAQDRPRRVMRNYVADAGWRTPTDADYSRRRKEAVERSVEDQIQQRQVRLDESNNRPNGYTEANVFVKTNRNHTSGIHSMQDTEVHGESGKIQGPPKNRPGRSVSDPELSPLSSDPVPSEFAKEDPRADPKRKSWKRRLSLRRKKSGDDRSNKRTKDTEEDAKKKGRWKWLRWLGLRKK